MSSSRTFFRSLVLSGERNYLTLVICQAFFIFIFKFKSFKVGLLLTSEKRLAENFKVENIKRNQNTFQSEYTQI